MEKFMNPPEVLIPILAVLLPAIIVWIVFVYNTRNNKNKYDAIVAASQNINNPEDIKELLGGLKDRKSSLDLRRSGVVTIFAGIGLFFFGYFGLQQRVVYGSGLLVAFIGIGQMIAGYIYPNQSEEINKAVENFEKKQRLGKDHKKLLNNLEELRKSAGLTQQELSVAAEVSRKSINAIENGIYVPSTVLALKIAKTIKCKVEDLFKLP